MAKVTDIREIGEDVLKDGSNGKVKYAWAWAVCACFGFILTACRQPCHRRSNHQGFDEDFSM